MSGVSVVIPTYNGASFITDSLASVFEQSVRPAEIIVADDCSSDDTAVIVRSMAQRSSIPLRFLQLSVNSGGPSRPLNVGISAATQEIIVLLEQDDLMRPRRIETNLKAISAFPQCTVTMGRFIVVSNDGHKKTSLWAVPQFHDLAGHIDEQAEYSIVSQSAAFRALLIRNFAASNSNLCFTKRSWESIGRFNENVFTCSDLDFVLRATLSGPIVIANETILTYRARNESLYRLNTTKSELEATMVRLRAASERPLWADDDFERLRCSALPLGIAALKRGDFDGARAIVEILAHHKGLLILQRIVANKLRRLLAKLGR